MIEQEFLELLSEEMLATKNISITVTKAKGIITLFWSVTFANKTNKDFFNLHYDEINWANLKIQQIAKKYERFHIKTKLMDEEVALSYDHYWATTKQAPVKKFMQTDTMSFGGYVQFVFKP